jgi:hypothetical protein
MANELIPFAAEIKVPDNWDCDESIKKIRPLVKKWTGLSIEMLWELKIAKEALKVDRISNLSNGHDAMSIGWNGYCEQIGISLRHADRLISDAFEAPLLYNIWNVDKGDDNEHFGHFPFRFMRNLLYYHTEEGQFVYDPFAGSGTTIDACKDMKRKYYCSDLIPKRDEIKSWDVGNGLPDDLPSVDLAFLDPPYWKQAEGKYSESEKDLSNVSLAQFYKLMDGLLCALSNKEIPKIAIVIAPTQWPNEGRDFEDHSIRFAGVLWKKYKIEMRYCLPYSTQQYNGNQVIIAKKEKLCMNIIRDLVVWRIK